MDGRAGQGPGQTVIRTIDAHAAGGPLRLVVDGFPSPRGNTMAKKLAWANDNLNSLRRSLIFEPRGHTDMWGAVLTEPTNLKFDAGILFFHNGGFAQLSGHGILAAAKIALDRGLIMPHGGGSTIGFDTDVGTARVTVDGARVSAKLPMSHVLHAGVPVQLGPRTLLADIVSGAGVFYAVVDAEAAGVAIDAAHAPELRRLGMAIRDARTVITTQGTVFTGPAHEAGADLRIATVFGNGALERSPSGTGMAGVMAVLDAMGLLPDDRPFVAEGIAGTRLSARLKERTTIALTDDTPGIFTVIEGDAWITGEHTFVFQDGDSLPNGFRV